MHEIVRAASFRTGIVSLKFAVAMPPSHERQPSCIDLYTRLRAQAEQLKPEPKDRDRCEVSLSFSHSWKSGGHARGGEVDRRERLEYFPIQFYIYNF